MGAHEIIWICDLTGEGAGDLQEQAGWSLRVSSPEAASSVLSSGGCAAAVLDCPIPGWTAAGLLEEVQRASPHLPVLIRDRGISPADAVRLARLGAHQFLTAGQEPFPMIEQAIEEHRRRDLARLAAATGNSAWERLLIGESSEMRQIAHIIRLVGGRRATVMITAKPEPEKNWPRVPFIWRATGGPPPWSRSIAARCLRVCSKASSSGT